MKGYRESGYRNTDDEKTGEVHLVQVFGVEKEVGDAQVLPEVAGYHGKQDDPAQHKHMITPEVVEQQLQREGIPKCIKKVIKPSHSTVRGFFGQVKK